ncbi:MAG: TonB-dependent hemoglobin/transferrin/lactoferrin family receptor [Alphaproteobacteria bacterium]|nr:MAG: TonB-dependent hemoglobin/transferrin/lactoferrin family receptor [Alphaproteobacteria bacterium]
MAGTVFSTVALAFGSGEALAQTGPAPETIEDDQRVSRDQVTVTATRIEQRTDEVPATVSVISDKTIEDELVTDIKDLVRFEPGVTVRSSPARFGAALGSTGRDRNAGFSIRGLEGNRVLVQVDGIRVPDAYAFGPTANGRGDYVDLDLLKSVEILRGPASALYGSDGVAGAVSFITRDPDDLVQEGRSFGARARSSYSSADESWANSVIGATVFGDWSAMLSYTRREAEETHNKGTNYALNAARTAPNPGDFQSDAVLGKIVWAPGDMHRFRFTFDSVESEATADVLSGRSATVLQVLAEDTSKRQRYSFDHEMDLGDGFFQSARWNVYSQKSKTRQFTFEDRTPAVDRTRDNLFDNSVWGASAQAVAGFDAGWGEHRIIAGADYSETEQAGIRGGTVPTPPDVFPTRAFPVTEYKLAGVFLQDQISFLDGKITVHPALRYDSFELTPKPDALYPTAVQTKPSDGSKVSPKIGVVAWPQDWFGLFANYGEGYKAPEPSQVNNSFSNLAFGYTSIANSDLKPESSKSTEIGARMRNINALGGVWAGEVVAFSADYKDFISQEVVSGIGTPINPLVYQYVNVAAVQVDGVEAKLNARWDNGLGVRAAAAYTEGDDKLPGSTLPRQSIDPYKIVAGLTFDDPGKLFGGQLIGTYVGPKEGDRIAQNINPSPNDNLFETPAYFTLDLTAYWNITDFATVRAGAFNLFDAKYWMWSDVRGVSAYVAPFPPAAQYLTVNPLLDAYTQTGANYSVSLTLKY